MNWDAFVSVPIFILNKYVFYLVYWVFIFTFVLSIKKIKLNTMNISKALKKGLLTKTQAKNIRQRTKAVLINASKRNAIVQKLGFSGMKEVFDYELSLLGVQSFSELNSTGTNFSKFRKKVYKKYNLS